MGVAVGAAAMLLSFLQPPFTQVMAAEDLVNTGYFGDVAIKGYDPVAYFTENQAIEGSETYSYHWLGATWYFASARNRDLFKGDPSRYAPQYGAFCGYAVSIGKLRPVDPTIYQIENGRLILQHTQEAYDLFNKNLKTSIERADKNWPGIVANHIGKPVKYDEKAKATASSN